MFKRVDLRDGSVKESHDTRGSETNRENFDRQVAANIEQMLEAMTFHKDGVAGFLREPFTKENWMVNILEENLSLRESDLDGSLVHLIERTLADNSGPFAGVFSRLHVEGYDRKMFAERILAIIMEVIVERKRIRNTINKTI